MRSQREGIGRSKMKLGTHGPGGRQWDFRPHPLPPTLTREQDRESSGLSWMGSTGWSPLSTLLCLSPVSQPPGKLLQERRTLPPPLTAQQCVLHHSWVLAASFTEVLEEARVCGWRAGGSTTQRTSCSKKVWVKPGKPDSC